MTDGGYNLLNCLKGTGEDPNLAFRNVVAFLDESGAVVILVSPETDDEGLANGFDFDPSTSEKPWPYPELVFGEGCQITTRTWLPVSASIYLKCLKAAILSESDKRLSFCVQIDIEPAPATDALRAKRIHSV